MADPSAVTPELTTNFCKALYDYTSADDSSLSFAAGDVIEVLTQLSSGWWDGIVRGRRGWFPSNFVQSISDAEAAQLLPHDPAENWLHGEVAVDAANAFTELANSGSSHPNDFWMPQVTPEGHIYYLNTQTGETCVNLPVPVELPMEPFGDDTDTGSSNFYPTSSENSRNSSREGPSTSSDGANGFGSSTTEPWQRRVADDGRSYYYNVADGSVSWTLPEASVAPQESFIPDTRASILHPQRPRDVPSIHVPTGPPASLLADEDTAKALAAALDSALPHDVPESLDELANAVRSALEEVSRVVERPSDFGREEALSPLVDVPGAKPRDVPQTPLYAASLAVVGKTREMLNASGAAHAGSALTDVWTRILLLPEPTERPRLPSSLKQSQRKAAATLSKLVLSARASGLHPSLAGAEARQRLTRDAADLGNSVRSFAGEWAAACAEIAASAAAYPGAGGAPTGGEAAVRKALPRPQLAAMGGAAATALPLASLWIGRGSTPEKKLDLESAAEAAVLATSVETSVTTLQAALRAQRELGAQGPGDHTDDLHHAERLRLGRLLLGTIRQFLNHISNIDVLSRIDLDGPAAAAADEDGSYAALTAAARTQVSILEQSAQTVCDGAADVLVGAQVQPTEVGSLNFDMLDVLAEAARSVANAFDELYKIADAQAVSPVAISGFAYIGIRCPPAPEANGATSTVDGDDDGGTLRDPSDGASVRTGETIAPPPPAKPVAGPPPGLDSESEDDYGPRRAKGGNKLKKLFPDLPDTFPLHDGQPWYMLPTHGLSEITIPPEGVRSGTLPALIERLTMHEYRDANFIDTFILTYRSFTTSQEVVSLLIGRFNLQPPDGINEAEFQDWAEKKQKVVQLRVINIMTILLKEGGLDKDDAEVIQRIRDFARLAQEEIGQAALPLQNVVDRARSGSDARPVQVFSTGELPPPPVVPKNLKKLKLLDLEPLEMARQLSIIESKLYGKIRLIDCLQRAKEQQSTEGIKAVIDANNNISNWVAESTLALEDPKKRAASLRHFIAVGEQCRALQNFASMSAIVAGLNSPAIRRLKRSWDLVPSKLVLTFESLEKSMESAKNFTTYKAALEKIQGPCVPFLGVYLTALTFVQDGAKDILPGKDGTPQINFQKRQKAADVLREIKRHQRTPYNLTVVPQVVALIEESLASLRGDRDALWELSLEREPRETREREDEKVQRLLQDSGFV